jgi:ATP-dependent Clp protease protease subunit
MNDKNNPVMNIPNPAVIEVTPQGERHYDVYSRLLKDRIVYLGTQVVPASANLIIAQLLFLEADNPEKPIHLYINSPGGSVHDGLAIYDIIQFIKAPVYTYAIGMAASMGSFLAMCGQKGHRYILPNTLTMIHQPHLGNGGIGGTVTDIEIAAKNLSETKEKLTRIYSVHSGQEYDKLRQLMERDKYLTSKEAVELGLADVIIDSEKLKALTGK